MAPIESINKPVVMHNFHGPDKNVSNRRGTMTAFLNAVDGGIGGFNEFNPADHVWFAAEVAKRKLRWYRAAEDGVVWDPAVFHAGKVRVKKIMQGGYVGADGGPGGDRRRVGPNRYAIYYPFTVINLDLNFEFVVTHLVARAFTVAKWRIRIFNSSVNALSSGVVSPNGIMVGDMNDPNSIKLYNVAEVPVPAPATMGKQHYDQILRWGSHIFIWGVRAINTPSDHHMLKGKITFYRNPQAHLVPAPASHVPTAKPHDVASLPAPGKAGVKWKKYGSPVLHPWLKRYDSALFKKRRPVLAKRIAAWKSAYRRRL